MSSPPTYFESYWARLDEELAKQPSIPALEPAPRHSTDHFQVFALRLTSLGPYRIFGFFSVPAGPGPFPGLLEIPRYGSVNNVPHWNDRLRYVVLALMHRGQRLADQPFMASYPGLLTHRIEDPIGYAYRGIVADCLRGAEFLMNRPEVDTRRVAVRGNDMALLVAALRGGWRAVQVEETFFYRAFEARLLTDSYPLEELNDYLRTKPTSEVAVAETLRLFDPVYHAPAISAPTALAIDEKGGLNGRDWLRPLVEALGAPIDEYMLSHRGAVDAGWFDSWLARQLGVQPMSRFSEARR